MSLSSDFQRHLEAIDSLVKDIESTADPAMRRKAAELLEAVMALHGAAIERVVEIARAEPDALHRLLSDELIASVLVLYDLHPLDLETRVRHALDKLRARGTKVEVLRIVDGEVRLQLRTESHSCGSPAQALKESIEEAVYTAAPDVAELTIEDAPAAAAFVSAASLSNGHGLSVKWGGS